MSAFRNFTVSALVVSSITIAAFVGCSEGPLWKVGRALPWVQQKWEEEEQIAETVYSKRKKLQAVAAKAPSFSSEDSDRYAHQLAEILRLEKTLVVRVECVRALAQIRGEAANAAMIDAARDAELEVRSAAVQGWKYRDERVAVGVLREVLGSDTDDDVRREALRSLSYFDGPEVVAALGSVLSDRDPATQFRAIESLEKVTGKRFGPNVAQWREFVAANQPRTGSEVIASGPAGDLK